jgi:hypothetical protein
MKSIAITIIIILFSINLNAADKKCKKCGYVYVISNVKSFGENVYKIGMTRRNDPMKRIEELSDASVPFDFDVHAIIYTEDAPFLEKYLHIIFKKNRINKKKEFFKVELDSIEKAVKTQGYSDVKFKKPTK